MSHPVIFCVFFDEIPGNLSPFCSLTKNNGRNVITQNLTIFENEKGNLSQYHIRTRSTGDRVSIPAKFAIAMMTSSYSSDDVIIMSQKCETIKGVQEMGEYKNSMMGDNDNEGALVAMGEYSSTVPHLIVCL